MKVLVTGATGFIGKRLAERLVREGHTVTGLTRNVEKATRISPGMAFEAWEPGEPLRPGLIDSVDAVVNLAGESVNGRWTAGKKARILESRVAGTRTLVDAINDAEEAKVLVNASAVGVYGDRGDAVLTEHSSPGEGFLKDVVLAWEAEARKAELGRNRVAVMRFGIVLGPEGGAMGKLLPLAKFGLSGPLGSGKQWWPWVHIDDLTSAISMALVHEMEGVFNVTAPQPVHQKEFAASLGHVLGRPAFLPAPAFALRLIQGEFADELLFSKRVMPQRLLGTGFNFLFPELEPALVHVVSKEPQLEDVPAHA